MGIAIESVHLDPLMSYSALKPHILGIHYSTSHTLLSALAKYHIDRTESKWLVLAQGGGFKLIASSVPHRK